MRSFRGVESSLSFIYLHLSISFHIVPVSWLFIAMAIQNVSVMCHNSLNSAAQLRQSGGQDLPNRNSGDLHSGINPQWSALQDRMNCPLFHRCSQFCRNKNELLTLYQWDVLWDTTSHSHTTAGTCTSTQQSSEVSPESTATVFRTFESGELSGRLLFWAYSCYINQATVLLRWSKMYKAWKIMPWQLQLRVLLHVRFS